MFWCQLLKLKQVFIDKIIQFTELRFEWKRKKCWLEPADCREDTWFKNRKKKTIERKKQPNFY
jgi:hypothetical protein